MNPAAPPIRRFEPWVLGLARTTSFLGHPFVTISTFLVFLSSRQATTGITRPHALTAIAVMVVPQALWNARQLRLGAYSNFDVSVRQERDSTYLVALVLMLAGTILLTLAGTAAALRRGSMGMLGMFVLAAIVNRRVKLSLHTSVALYLSFAAFLIDRRLGVAFLAVSAAVALSRWILGRHSLLELVLGAALGASAGGALLASVLPAGH
jgi:membrane-associated phospholipid phosphatase